MPMTSFLAVAAIALVATVGASSAQERFTEAHGIRVDRFDAWTAMTAQPLESPERGTITAAHWVLVNRNKPAQEIVLDRPPRGFEGYRHGAIYEERGPRTFYCSHSLEPCRTWSDYGQGDTPPNKR